MKRLCVLRIYGSLKARGILPEIGKHMSVKMIDRLMDYSSSPSSDEYVRAFKDLLRWIYNNSGEDIVTHYSNFI